MARWSDGFVELVKDTAERVVGCAKQILGFLELADGFPSQPGATLNA